jgi:hypothetical protein
LKLEELYRRLTHTGSRKLELPELKTVWDENPYIITFLYKTKLKGRQKRNKTFLMDVILSAEWKKGFCFIE